MKKTGEKEVWLRGQRNDIPILINGVAHAMLQAGEELDELLSHFPDENLWHKPVGMASPAFHLQHMKGVLDRLFTYARGESLSEKQLNELEEEGKKNTTLTTESLLKEFHLQVKKSIDQLKSVYPAELSDERLVGRGKIPSTQMGLYIHAAEHIMRHLGQLIVTIKVLQSGKKL